MAVRIEPKEIAKGLDGDDCAGDGIPLRHRLSKKKLQGFPGAAAQIGISFTLRLEQEQCDKSTYSVKPVVTLLMDGKPIENEAVLFEVKSIPWASSTITGTDGISKSGFCRFDPKPGKTYKLIATSRGQTREVMLEAQSVCARANANFSFSVSLENSSCNTGTYSVNPVATALLDGKPAQGENIAFEIKSIPWSAMLVTLADGKTKGLTKTFEPVEGRTYKLEVTARGQKKEVILDPAAACRDRNKNYKIDLVLENQRCVNGKYSADITAIITDNGTPVSGESVALEIRAIPWSSRLTTGADGKTRGGSITIDAIRGKTYQLTATARGKTREATIDIMKACGW